MAACTGRVRVSKEGKCGTETGKMYAGLKTSFDKPALARNQLTSSVARPDEHDPALGG